MSPETHFTDFSSIIFSDEGDILSNYKNPDLKYNQLIRIEEELGLPLIGQVAAGEPILAQEHIERHYQLDESMFYPSAQFLLRVNGMSMRNIGILDGDLLAVHKTEQARNGQIVVARVEDEVTVKRFEQKGRQVLLHPENEEFSTIVVDLAQQVFAIEGLAVGIIRNGASL